MHLFSQKLQQRFLASGEELLITHIKISFGLVLRAFLCDVKNLSKNLSSA